MKLFTFSLLIIAIVFTIGCYTENPICSDNYCVSGEIFLRSELKEGEVFSEINVVESSLIAAIANTTVATPVETTPLTPEENRLPRRVSHSWILSMTLARVAKHISTKLSRLQPQLLIKAMTALQSHSTKMRMFLRQPKKKRSLLSLVSMTLYPLLAIRLATLTHSLFLLRLYCHPMKIEPSTQSVQV